MNIQEAKSIPLPELLKQLGHLASYTKNNGNELWYCSPLRKEKKPSFHINVLKNIWFDFGIGKGGNIIDFIMCLRHTNVSGALTHLNQIWGREFCSPKISKSVREINNPKTTILEFKEVRPISYSLKNYLSTRKIAYECVHLYVDEVVFQYKQKEYFALGMKNNSNGWELRNKIFKGCLPPKDISVFYSNSNPFLYLSIFEGMFDFLSLLCYQYPKPILGTVVVLHSTSNITKLAQFLLGNKGYKKVFTFLDNDKAGEKTTQKIRDLVSIQVFEKNNLYKGYQDLNDWWCTCTIN